MAAIRSIETAVPRSVIVQGEFRDLLAAQPAYGRLGKRLVTAAFDASAIDTRHTVIDEFGAGPGPEHPEFFDPSSGQILRPGTRARNGAYVRAAGPLVVEAARKALAAAPDLRADQITHVVTVSCTGFSAPGPDFVLVRELGLRPSTQRYHLGFMGCYGAFPALRAAEQFCAADPDAVVLVVSVELCSLHVHVDDDPDTIVAASVFADGAAAALVTSRPAPTGSAVLDLDAFETVLVPEGEGEMAWTIGDHGFDMILSSYVPRIVEQHIRSALEPLFARDPLLSHGEPAAIERWAIHPGGRSILDRVQTNLGLSDDQLAPSRDVLRTHGNMSSATVLFVLRQILHPAAPARLPELALVGSAASGDWLDGTGATGADVAESTATRATATRATATRATATRATATPATATPATPTPAATDAAAAGPERVCAMAFGPGLTVESALLTRRVEA